MKKFFLTIVMAFVCGLSTYAHYEKNYPVTATQPDGTIVECFTTGDEFYRWVHDANGFTLIQDPQTGVVVYAKLENDVLVSTGHRVGSIDPATIGLTPWQIISAEKRLQLRSEFLKNIPEKPVKEGYQKSKSGWNNGELNNLVIYIRFSDETEFPPKGEIFYNYFNEDNPGRSSMYAYFKALSNEKTFIFSTFYPDGCSGEVIVSYQDIHPRSYFQPYNATTNPNGYQGGDNGSERTQREHQLLKRAVEAVADQIPEELDLDFNGDGLVDNICFVVKGAPGAWASLLWPHRWALYTESVYIHGQRVWDFNFLLENGLGSSVLAHEMFHTLGAPDLYRYSDGTIDPVGSWDLMCSNSTPPQSTTAWMKYKYGGWIEDIPEIPGNGTFTLNNVWSETNNAYKIPSPSSTTEFFVVEYRDKSVYWDSSIPGSGLLIYRINTKESGNAGGPPDELYIFRPGGTNTTTNGSLGSAHFSENVGRTVFNNVSNPPCFLSNNQPGNIAILIGNTRDGTISFEVNNSFINTEFSITPDNLTFANILLGTTSDPQTISITGKNIVDPITYEISGVDREFFTVEETTPWSPETGAEYAVKFTPSAVKIYSAKITFSSTGATPRTVSVKGSGTTVVVINEQEAMDGIVVYPNPTGGELKISMSDYQICDIRLFDILGRQISVVGQSEIGQSNVGQSNVGQSEIGQSEIAMNISDLPSGIYFIRIQTENSVVTRKVVKQ